MNKFRYLLTALLLTFISPGALGDQAAEAENKVVIGPRNPDLKDGAEELLAGHVEEGIRLTRLGLNVAVGRREHIAGLSNLCAGYVMLENYETALEFCNRALEINDRTWRALSNRALVYVKLKRFEEAGADLDRAAEIAPYATSVKEVRGMLLDATDPVEPNIIIDDRRDAGASDEG